VVAIKINALVKVDEIARREDVVRIEGLLKATEGHDADLIEKSRSNRKRRSGGGEEEEGEGEGRGRSTSPMVSRM